MGTMLDIGFYKAMLFVSRGEFTGVKSIGLYGIVVVVTPFRLIMLSPRRRLWKSGDLRSGLRIRDQERWQRHIRSR